jgi:hypothetical protein
MTAATWDGHCPAVPRPTPASASSPGGCSGCGRWHHATARSAGSTPRRAGSPTTSWPRSRALRRPRRAAAMTTGTCQHCARTKRLNGEGLVPLHMLSIDVSRRAIRAIGTGRVRRRCPDSGNYQGGKGGDCVLRSAPVRPHRFVQPVPGRDALAAPHLVPNLEQAGRRPAVGISGAHLAEPGFPRLDELPHLQGLTRIRREAHTPKQTAEELPAEPTSEQEANDDPPQADPIAATPSSRRRGQAA